MWKKPPEAVANRKLAIGDNVHVSFLGRITEMRLLPDGTSVRLTIEEPGSQNQSAYMVVTRGECA